MYFCVDVMNWELRTSSAACVSYAYTLVIHTVDGLRGDETEHFSCIIVDFSLSVCLFLTLHLIWLSICSISFWYVDWLLKKKNHTEMYWQMLTQILNEIIIIQYWPIETNEWLHTDNGDANGCTKFAVYINNFFLIRFSSLNEMLFDTNI